MVLMAPRDENELQHMLQTAVEHEGPIALRYPRGDGYGVPLEQKLKKLPIGKGEILRSGKDGAVLAVGVMVNPALEAANALVSEGIDLSVVNARFIKPLDRELIVSLACDTCNLFTVEDSALMGGFGSAVLELLEEEGIEGVRVTRLGYPDRYIEQGEQPELKRMYGLDVDGIASGIRRALGKG
jgi:1-deoxy-D-xylulose-5-phosphate synthase